MKAPFKRKRISILGLFLSRLPCEFLGVCILLTMTLSSATGGRPRSTASPDITDLDYTYSYKLNQGVKNPSSFRNSKNYDPSKQLATTSITKLSTSASNNIRMNSSSYSLSPHYHQDFFSASPSSIKRNRVPVR